MKRRFHRTTTRRKTVYAVVVLAFVLRIGYLSLSDFHVPPNIGSGKYVVAEVLDGFHFRLRPSSNDVLSIKDSSTIPATIDSRQFGVRLLGAQSSHSQKWNSRATDFATQQLRNRTVDVRLDRRRRDHDGWNLVHLYLDGKLISAELIRAGLARRDSAAGDSSSICRLLKKAEDEARQLNAGFWQKRPTVDQIAKQSPHP